MRTRHNIHHDELLELFVTDITTKLKKISTEDLEMLANDIHIELLERDDSYVNSMDDGCDVEGDKL